MGKLAPGDVVSFRGGRYDHSKAFAARNLRGAKGRPIVFRAYPGERPVFDGTLPIRGTWKRHADGIYKIDVGRPMWQLFVGRRVMSEARWPTMLYHDGYAVGTAWDREGRYARAAVPGSRTDPRSRCRPPRSHSRCASAIPTRANTLQSGHSRPLETHVFFLKLYTE